MHSGGISVLKIGHVLLVTVPPDPDDETVSRFQDKVLRAIEKHEAEGLVLDIGTVEILDSFFARTIAETAEMVELMGGHTVIAGMRAPVAITATQLGLTMGKAGTALSVESALEQLSDG